MRGSQFPSASYISGQTIPNPAAMTRRQRSTTHQPRYCSSGSRSSASTLLSRRKLAGLSSKISTRRIALPSCEIDSDTTAKNRLPCSIRDWAGSGKRMDSFRIGRQARGLCSLNRALSISRDHNQVKFLKRCFSARSLYCRPFFIGPVESNPKRRMTRMKTAMLMAPSIIDKKSLGRGSPTEPQATDLRQRTRRKCSILGLGKLRLSSYNFLTDSKADISTNLRARAAGFYRIDETS